jgi:hypothetical protein
MSKRRKVDVKDINDALERLNSPHEGDQIIVRAMPLSVPSPSYDVAITNASMQLLIDSFNNDPNAAKKYSPTLCKDGVYEVVTVFHIRRIDDYEAPLLN